MDTRTLLAQMQQCGLWPTDDSARAALGTLARRHVTDVRACTRELLQRNLLTAYQANALLTGKSQQLLIGPYLVWERLGEGGMGQVFKARRRGTEHFVALKVIKPDRVANPTALQRFFREVRAAAQMNDPNIVRAEAADKAGDTYYFAMEYVRGTDLAEFVKSRGPLPIDLACQFLAQAALGLQHIHDHGMVHRDIKPSNLMLALEETPALAADGGVVVRTAPSVLKILDLGLARLTEDDTRNPTGSQLGLTHEGAVIGTADYMSPEQARDSRDADIRSDIYSLGCTFYYALTAQVPFPGGTGIEKMLRHQLDEPAPLDRFRPHVPALLATILKKMTAKQPADRYQKPAEIVAALVPLVAAGGNAPPLAIPVGGPDQQTISDVAAGATLAEKADPPGRVVSVGSSPKKWILIVLAVCAAGFVISALLLALLLWFVFNH